MKQVSLPGMKVEFLLFPVKISPNPTFKTERKRQKVSHCGGRVPRHKASGEPEG